MKSVEGVYRREENWVFHPHLCSPLAPGMGAEGKERPQQVVCYRVKNVTREFDVKKRRTNVI